jgi:hypothetical protein
MKIPSIVTLSIFALLGLILTGCGNRADSVYKEKYKPLVFYADTITHRKSAEERTSRYLCDDSLYIFFENTFDLDTIDLRINGKDEGTRILTTDRRVGVADVTILGDIKSIGTIEITKNNGPPLTIELRDKKMYIWRVLFYKDTLEARWTKFLLEYD